MYEHKTMINFSVRLLVYTSIFSNVYSSIAEEVNYVCGGMNTCSAGSNNSLPSDSCCRPCECDKTCLEKGTCCSDIENISDRTGKVIKQACLPSIKHSTFEPSTSNTERFYVRAKCPESYTDQQTRLKCETEEPKSFEDLPFVSSNNGKIVYKNKHCAICHDENDVIPWKLVIDKFCIRSAFMSNHNASSLAETLMKSCSLPFMRPNITPWKHVVCHEEKDLISNCLDAGSQDPSSESTTNELKEMCRNDKSALTVFERNNVYANVYCYLCNRRLMHTCGSVIDDQKYQTSIYFLLDFTPIKDNQHEVELKKQACDHQEFYDMYFETCRRIHCPLFEVLSHGKCTSVVDSSRLNYGFSFVFVPEAVSRNNQRDADKSHTAVTSEELSKFITPELGLESCLVCSLTIWSNLSNSSTKSVVILYLKIVFTTAPHCERELLLSTAAKLEDKEKENKSLTVVVETLSLRTEYIPSDETFRKLRGNSERVFTFKTCASFNPSKFINCPKVTLTVEEYETIVNKLQLTNLQAARSNEGIEVCLDDYKIFSNAERSNGKRARITSYLLIPYMTLVVMCVATLA